jgi:hypothetical protein
VNNIINDGLNGLDGDDDDRVRLIKGIKLRFTNDAEWIAGDDVIAADREFLVVEIIKGEQKWIDDRSVETRILGATEKFSDLEKLNDAAPREEWREKFGKEVGPWEHCHVAYLVDPETWQIYTFPTSTGGGGQCVRELRESTGLVRRVRGPDINPRVRLSNTFMKTSYGGRQRPSFEIIGYESLKKATLGTEPNKPLIGPGNGNGAAKLIEAKPSSEHKAKSAAPKSKKLDPDFDTSTT